MLILGDVLIYLAQNLKFHGPALVFPLLGDFLNKGPYLVDQIAVDTGEAGLVQNELRVMLDNFLRDLANNFDVYEALPTEALLQLLLAKEMLLLEIMVAGVEIHVLSCIEYLDDADVELDHESGIVDLLPLLDQQGA